MSQNTSQTTCDIGDQPSSLEATHPLLHKSASPGTIVICHCSCCACWSATNSDPVLARRNGFREHSLYNSCKSFPYDAAKASLRNSWLILWPERNMHLLWQWVNATSSFQTQTNVMLTEHSPLVHKKQKKAALSKQNVRKNPRSFANLNVFQVPQCKRGRRQGRSLKKIIIYIYIL